MSGKIAHAAMIFSVPAVTILHGLHSNKIKDGALYNYTQSLADNKAPADKAPAFFSSKTVNKSLNQKASWSNITKEQLLNLTIADKLVGAGLFEQGLSLRYWQREMLSYFSVQQLIRPANAQHEDSNCLNVSQFLQLSDHQLKNLIIIDTWNFFCNFSIWDFFSLSQILELTSQHLALFKSPVIMQLLDEHMLLPQDFLAWSKEKSTVVRENIAKMFFKVLRIARHTEDFQTMLFWQQVTQLNYALTEEQCDQLVLPANINKFISGVNLKELIENEISKNRAFVNKI